MWKSFEVHNSCLKPGVEFCFGSRESKLILKFQLLHISMEKLILISRCYENHCENRFSDSRRISSPENHKNLALKFQEIVDEKAVHV